MQIRGIVQRAELVENPAGSDRIEMIIWGQGVGPNKPRSFIIPFELLLSNASIDPETIQGHGFQAVIEEDPQGRWLASQIGFATGRVL
jgi:hypothetical protein